MKADLSRLRFDRARNYTSVVAQQGRVQLDSDANEQRAIDDPGIKDVALGEEDTTDRVQTVWRVVAAAAQQVRGLSCCDAMRRSLLTGPPGRMTAGTQNASGQGTCLPSPQAAYRGLENQL